MDRLPPIPCSPAHLWREFRFRLFPVAVFVAAVAAVVLLWRQDLAAPTLVGEVETIQANIASPKSGTLAQLNVTRFQRVKTGDVIAHVMTTDPQILQSSLAVIEAEIRLLRVNLDPLLGPQRFAISYDRLRLDWMDQRVQLVTAKVRLELAEAELRRSEELFRGRVVSEQVLDTTRAARASLLAEVEERSRLVAEQERKLQELGLTDEGSWIAQASSPEEVLRASIRVQEEKLRLTEAELSPIELKVPMDGTISAIHHRSGEAVMAGQAIVTLTALSSDRILSYIRQPLLFEPKVGMRVEVRARSLDRSLSEGEILEVGSQLEPISAALAPLHGGQFHPTGLPVLVSMPPSHKLHPGELVDLRVLGRKARPVSAEWSAVH